MGSIALTILDLFELIMQGIQPNTKLSDLFEISGEDRLKIYLNLINILANCQICSKCFCISDIRQQLHFTHIF